MKNLTNRIASLEKSRGIQETRPVSVHFVSTPEEARTGDPNSPTGMWGSGNGAWHIYKAPGQSQDDALHAAGIDTEKDNVIIWPTVGP
jgi:hypothetical protein